MHCASMVALAHELVSRRRRDSVAKSFSANISELLAAVDSWAKRDHSRNRCALYLTAYVPSSSKERHTPADQRQKTIVECIYIYTKLDAGRNRSKPNLCCCCCCYCLLQTRTKLFVYVHSIDIVRRRHVTQRQEKREISRLKRQRYIYVSMTAVERRHGPFVPADHIYIFIHIQEGNGWW